jgi:peptidoglycan/LPS O-acetylase OafA/YrhL
MDIRPRTDKLKPGFSGFLDFLRVGSALTVFLAHLSYDRFGGNAISVFGPLAHDAVIVFFLLSGYLISWAARRDGKTAVYMTNRIARIYTVAVPALVLTYAIDSFLIAHYPGEVRSGYQIAQPFKYLPVFLTFSTDFWFLGENAFSNAPYWSLCYECWYYVVFGIAFFGHGKVRLFSIILVLLLMGPKLWLLFPIWLAGAWVQFLHRSWRASSSTAMWLIAIGVVLLLIFKLSGWDVRLDNAFDAVLGGFPKAGLRYSQFVAGDYLFSIFVGAIILGAGYFPLSLFASMRSPLAKMASVSFSLYLTHFPLLLLFGAIWPRHVVGIGIAALVSSIIFGRIFETRTNNVRYWLSRIFRYNDIAREET